MKLFKMLTPPHQSVGYRFARIFGVCRRDVQR